MPRGSRARIAPDDRDPDLRQLLRDIEAARLAFEQNAPVTLIHGHSVSELGAPLRAALVERMKTKDGANWAELERVNPALAAALEAPVAES
jgi:hypothetical protein